MKEMKERNDAETAALEETVIFIETERDDGGPADLEVTTVEKVPTQAHFHEKEWRELYQVQR